MFSLSGRALHGFSKTLHLNAPKRGWYQRAFYVVWPLWSSSHQITTGVLRLTQPHTAFYHTTGVQEKQTEKQKNILQNDPYYQGQLKKQKMKETLQKDTKLQQEQGVTLQSDMVSQFHIFCTEKIQDPSLPPLSRPSVLTLAFWKETIIRVVGLARTLIIDPYRFANFIHKNKLPKIRRVKINGMAKTLYVRFNQDLAAMKSHKNYVGENLLQEVKLELQKRGNNPHVEFKWNSSNLQCRLISFRFLTIPYPHNKSFLQVVYRFKSNQTVQVVDRITKEVVGGVSEPVLVTDYWGFEKRVDDADSPWVIVERFKRQ